MFGPARPTSAPEAEKPSLSSLLQDMPAGPRKRMGDFVEPDFKTMANQFHVQCDDTVILCFPDAKVVEIWGQFETITLLVQVKEETLAQEMQTQFDPELYAEFVRTIQSTPFNFPFAKRSEIPIGSVCLKVKISRKKLDTYFRPGNSYEKGCLCDLSIIPSAYVPFKNITVPGISFKVGRVDNVRY